QHVPPEADEPEPTAMGPEARHRDVDTHRGSCAWLAGVAIARPDSCKGNAAERSLDVGFPRRRRDQRGGVFDGALGGNVPVVSFPGAPGTLLSFAIRCSRLRSSASSRRAAATARAGSSLSAWLKSASARS